MVIIELESPTLVPHFKNTTNGLPLFIRVNLRSSAVLLHILTFGRKI